MKILHVINSLVAAGAENLVVTLANEQVRTEEVSLFTFYSEKDAFTERLSNDVRFFPSTNHNYLSLQKLRKLLKLMKSHDIIHVHLFPPFYLVAFLSFFVKNKVFIYTEHTTFNFRRKWIFKWLEKLIYSRYDRIICISDGTELALKSWMGNSIKSKVIKNVINLKEIQDAEAICRAKLSIPPENRTICMVGRFQEPKDQDTLIKALKLLPKYFMLLLVGEGERESLLRELVASLGLSDRVKFLGIRTDVYSVLKSCDYGVLSSNWEGFGIVALEYMACDTLAIGSKLKGLSEVIEHEKCLFEVGDHQGLAQILQYFEVNSEEYNRFKKMQKEHLQNFDVEIALRAHFEVYNLEE